MPAGVTWPVYLRFFAASMLTMMAGAQTVHLFYRPLEDMEEWIEKEKVKLEKEVQKSTENSSS